MNPTAIVVATLVTAALLVGAGWKAHAWFNNSKQLEVANAIIADKTRVESERDKLDAETHKLRTQLASTRSTRPAVCDQSDSRMRVLQQAASGPMPEAAADQRPSP